MNLDRIAKLVLDAVDRIDPETRYEEKTDRPTANFSTNAALRRELGGCETPYHGCGDRCDVVFEVDGEQVWLEAKHSWTWSTYRRPEGSNPSYSKHLFGENSASSLHDAGTKLPRLVGQPGVDAIAMLVIALGSTSRPHPDGDIRKLVRLAGLGAAPWKEFGRPERASRVPGYGPILVRPYLWIRPAASTTAPRRTGTMT